MFPLNRRKALIAGGLVAAVAAPTAAIGAGEGQPVDGGARNPSRDTRQAYTKETEVIARTSTYGTRQSNKSDNGGGAVYGCRSKPGGTAARNEPCLRGTNLNTGSAFEFETRGALAGTITAAGGDNAKPFTTNATGVATGLNADRLDGRDAADFMLKSEKADLVAKNELLFARVTAAGNVASGRGATAATVDETTNTFTVTFDRDIEACAITATLNTAVADDERAISAAATGPRTVTVDQDEHTEDAQPFSLQIAC